MIDGNTLLSDVSSKFGAPMGRITVEENPRATVTLFRVRMVDGDYDAGGAYWGGGTPLYAAIGDGFQYFVRAKGLEEAKQAIQDTYPDLTIQLTEVNDDFVEGYITAALWSTNDDEDVPLDSNYSADDLTPETRQEMVDDCRKFLEQYGHLFTEENCSHRGCSVMSYAGHDFWLTRNGHGCGFEDGDWKKAVANKLARAARSYKEFYLFVGDDGKICT